MGGFGALDSMNKSISNNRNLLRKKNGFEILKDHVKWGTRKKYRYKQSTQEQLSTIRKKMQKIHRQNMIKSFVAGVVSIMLVIFLLKYFEGIIF